MAAGRLSPSFRSRRAWPNDGKCRQNGDVFRSHRDRHLACAVAASEATAGPRSGRRCRRIANCPNRADLAAITVMSELLTTRLGLPMLIDSRSMTASVAVVLGLQDLPGREEA